MSTYTSITFEESRRGIVVARKGKSKDFGWDWDATCRLWTIKPAHGGAALLFGMEVRRVFGSVEEAQQWCRENLISP